MPDTHEANARSPRDHCHGTCLCRSQLPTPCRRPGPQTPPTQPYAPSAVPASRDPLICLFHAGPDIVGRRAIPGDPPGRVRSRSADQDPENALREVRAGLSAVRLTGSSHPVPVPLVRFTVQSTAARPCRQRHAGGRPQPRCLEHQRPSAPVPSGRTAMPVARAAWRRKSGNDDARRGHSVRERARSRARFG